MEYLEWNGMECNAIIQLEGFYNNHLVQLQEPFSRYLLLTLSQPVYNTKSWSLAKSYHNTRGRQEQCLEFKFPCAALQNTTIGLIR